MLLSEINLIDKKKFMPHLMKQLNELPTGLVHVLSGAFAHGKEYFKVDDEEFKKLVIRILLLLVKEENVYSMRVVRDALKVLRDNGVKWPELDVIEKSTK